MKCAVTLLVLAWLMMANLEPVAAGVCPAPGAFTEDRIDGRWVGVVLDFKGEDGGPHAATVYTTTFTPHGVLLTTLGRVEAHGQDAAALHAMFFDDKLYVINDRSVRGSANLHHEYFAFAIQRFGIRDGKLIPEAEGVVTPSLLNYQLVAPGIDGDSCDTSRFDTSLKRAIETGTLDEIWTPVTSPTPR